jgi:hypothetical protein
MLPRCLLVALAHCGWCDRAKRSMEEGLKGGSDLLKKVNRIVAKKRSRK